MPPKQRLRHSEVASKSKASSTTSSATTHKVKQPPPSKGKSQSPHTSTATPAGPKKSTSKTPQSSIPPCGSDDATPAPRESTGSATSPPPAKTPKSKRVTEVLQSNTPQHGNSNSKERSASPLKAPPSSPVPPAQQKTTCSTPAKRDKTAPSSATEAAATPSGNQLKGKTSPSRSVKRKRFSGAEEAALTDDLPYETGAAGGTAFTRDVVERVVRQSKVIAPDVSGVMVMAVHPSEKELTVARENGSLVQYHLSTFQNVPQFTPVRHTGGQVQRSITGLHYVAVPTTNGVPAVSSCSHVLLASMLSGQVVVYDAELLTPLFVYQRSGGAIWGMHVVSSSCIYCAMADGGWHQLHLVLKKASVSGSPAELVPQLELLRIVPGVSGADRALTVSAAATVGLAVGTDDVGHVHTWRLPRSADDEDRREGGSRPRGLSDHEALWTTRLAKGIAMSSIIVGGGPCPAVVVGTSMGDIVFLDVRNGQVMHTFSQHKGPVVALAEQDGGTVYASGWHESLRSYRCSTTGEWYPAEVKRRTHYHEASQVAVLPQQKLILSASRDGTIMYAPLEKVFTAPAMYITVTTQQFAYAPARRLLLQTRRDAIEVFGMDAAERRWVPFMAHRLSGRFHLSGLWCDANLDYFVFSTDERVVLVRTRWRRSAAMVLEQLEEVCELPAGAGVLDVAFATTPGSTAASQKVAPEAAPHISADKSKRVYILYDDQITYISLQKGYPVVHTSLQFPGRHLVGDSIRPYSVLRRRVATSATRKQSSAAVASADMETTDSMEELIISGHRGSCRIALHPDGTPNLDTVAVQYLDDVMELVREVPTLRPVAPLSPSSSPAKKQRVDSSSEVPALASSMPPPTPSSETVLIGLSSKLQRYVVGLDLRASSVALLPATLPHDVRWIARMPLSSDGVSDAVEYEYLGYFSRGLLKASRKNWHMLHRVNVEAAVVLSADDAQVLVLERNLEKTLESLPLCWKVRRFGN